MRIRVSCLGAAAPELPTHNHRRHVDHRQIKWIGHHLLKRSPHNLQLVNALATAIGQALCHAVIGIGPDRCSNDEVQDLLILGIPFMPDL